MSLVLDLFTMGAVSVGAFFFLARLHALTKADNLGLGLIVVGLLPQVAWPFGAFKLMAVWLIGLFAATTVSQLMARAARDAGPPT